MSIIYINHSLASYSAFCRNYGNHTTSTVGYHDWNDEAITAMIDSMETPWEHLSELYESAKDEGFAEIEDRFQKAEVIGKQ